MIVPATSGFGAGIAVVGRQLAASSDDPRIFGVSAVAGWIAQTIAIPPVASTTPDILVSVNTVNQEVAGDTPLQLAASSTGATSFLWAADVGTFSNTAIENPIWTAPAAEANDRAVVLTLTVTGAGGVTASDSVTITVTGTDPTVNVDTANQEVAGSTPLQLAATATDVDSYAWEANPDVGTFSNAAIEDPTWTAPAAETNDRVVVLTLTVTDLDGNTASDSATVTVTGTGTGPTISIDTADQEIAGGVVLQLEASSSDADEFFVGCCTRRRNVQ